MIVSLSGIATLGSSPISHPSSLQIRSISSVNANGEQALVEYYTLEGMRVNQPVKGIYIMRQGNKVVKVSNK